MNLLSCLSSISSIFRQEQGLPKISKIHVGLLLGQLSQCSDIVFSCWSELHLQISVYCFTTP